MSVTTIIRRDKKINVKGNHVQCKLRRVNGDIDHSWIPQKFAKKGKFLKLKNENGEWENGWEVIETWGVKASADVLARTDDYKHQREASDV